MARITLINGVSFDVVEEYERLSGAIHAHTRTGGGTVSVTVKSQHFDGKPDNKKRTLIIQNILFIDA